MKRRFRAADISFTPRSLVFAVAMMEKPFRAGISSLSSGTETLFSERMEMRASCTSEAQREISSSLAILPPSMARKMGLFTSALSVGPSAISIA